MPVGPTRNDFEKALRQMLIASYAYGRTTSDAEQKRFHDAWDAAQALLRYTKDGAQRV